MCTIRFMTDLERAAKDFLDAKRLDVAKVTHQQQSFRLNCFVRFCKKAGVDSPAAIAREHITLYREPLRKF
jgi:hypothetical protein